MRFGNWLVVLIERWMAWLERPFLPWLERRCRCRCGLPLLISGKWCTGGHYQDKEQA